MKSHSLRYERELRGWSLQKVADALNITPRTVSRWERGITVPLPYHKEQLCTLFGQNARELGLLPEKQMTLEEETLANQSQYEVLSAPEKKSSIDDPMLPQMETSGLIGRNSQLQQLKLRFCTEGKSTISAIHGLPGIGKTALAVALVSDPQVQAQFCDGILWAGLGTTPNVLGLLARWAALLDVSPGEVGDTSSIQDWGYSLRTAIGKRRMLLVMDDVWQLDAALALKVGGPCCAYLVTTRIPQIAFGFATTGAIRILELSDADGLALLAQFSAELVAQEPEQMLALVRSVGALPLALTCMGKHLATQAYYGHSRRLQRAFEELQDPKRRLHLNVAIPFGVCSPGLPSNLSLSLCAAIDISNEHMSSSAREALLALSVFPAKPASFSEEAALAVTEMSVEVLDELLDSGLLENSYSERYCLHQTIADYARIQRTGTTMEERLIAYVVDNIERNAENDVALEQESSVILAGLHMAYMLGQHDKLLYCLGTIVRFLQICGINTLAARHLLAHCEVRASLRDIPDITSSLLHLGTNMQTWGDNVRIEIYLEKGLAQVREMEDWQSTVVFLTYLGWITSMQGNYGQAETYYRAGLAHVRQMGDRDRVQMLLAGLGWIAEKRGDCEQAQVDLQKEVQLASEDRVCLILENMLFAYPEI